MSDLIRTGYISAINYEEGTAQVVYKDRDDAVSPYMPLWSNEYNMPEIDTLVYVLHLPNGATRGMILVPPYTNENPPVEGKKGIWRKDFGDGSYIKYDYEQKKLEIVCDFLQVESIECESLETKSLTVSGNVHIGGDLTVDGSYPG